MPAFLSAGTKNQSMETIRVDGVSKRFRGRGGWFWALKDVSLSVGKGEIFGLLGPNGAGKTTLLNMMIRLLLPDSGSISILGKDVIRDAGVLERLNFVSGDTKFTWALRAVDILEFYCRAYRVPVAERKGRMRELMNFFGIGEFRNKYFSSMSTGQRMRLIFTKAMLNRPEVLLLDEPTLGLDPAIAIRVRDEIRRVSREFGTTILLTSHYMGEVEQLSDRVAFMHRGRIVDTGKVEKVKLRRFGTYDILVRVRKVFGRRSLKREGFAVSGQVLRKRLPVGVDVGSVLSLLHRKGFEVVDVETRKPTLEDYFVSMLKEGEA